LIHEIDNYFEQPLFFVLSWLPYNSYILVGLKTKF